MSIRGDSLRINNLELNVHVEGEGPAVLLLHGFPDSNALWRHVIPALAGAGFTVIAPDQRGFGESDAPQGVEHYRMAQIVSDAIGVLDALEIPKAHLVAHDYGALVGWLLAGQHGDRFYSYTALSVGHPTAYASAGGKQKRLTWFRSFFLIRGIAEAVLKAGNWAMFRLLVRKHPETTHWIEELSRAGRLTAALNWYRANVLTITTATDIPRVSIPVMGVWSSEDLALAEDQMVNSARYVDSTFRYERLDGCGHWIPLDRPETITALLLDFLAEQPKT